MKKTLLLALAAVATIFTSCSSDITNDNDDSNNGQGKGMTLIANVEQDDTRATLTTSDDISGKWSFKYTNNDKVSVGNDKITITYLPRMMLISRVLTLRLPILTPTGMPIIQAPTSTSPIRKAHPNRLLISTLWQVLQPQLQPVLMASLSI